MFPYFKIQKNILHFFKTLLRLSQKSKRKENFFAGGGVAPILPNSLVEWLILFLVLVILVLVLRQLYELYEEKRRQRKARTAAEDHMQQVREQVNNRLSQNGKQKNPEPYQAQDEDGSWEASLYGGHNRPKEEPKPEGATSAGEWDRLHSANAPHQENEGIKIPADPFSGQVAVSMSDYPQLVPAMTPWGVMYVPLSTPPGSLMPQYKTNETNQKDGQKEGQNEEAPLPNEPASPFSNQNEKDQWGGRENIYPSGPLGRDR